MMIAKIASQRVVEDTFLIIALRKNCYRACRHQRPRSRGDKCIFYSYSAAPIACVPQSIAIVIQALQTCEIVGVLYALVRAFALEPGDAQGVTGTVAVRLLNSLKVDF